MLPLKIKRHHIRFYLVQACLFLFLCAIGINISWRSIQAIRLNEATRGDYLALMAGIGLLVLAVFTLTRYLKNSPIVTVNDSTIRFGNNESYRLSDIKDVNLTGKVPFPLILDFPMEGTTIYFNDGTVKRLYDEIYTNAWELKSFLDQVVIEKKEYKESTAYTPVKNIGLLAAEFFRANPFLTFPVIMVVVFTGFIILILTRGPQPIAPVLYLFFVCPAVIALATASSMNYFGIAGDYLVVRNYFFSWKRRYYKLDQIKEIVFEQSGRSPNILRIIARNFNTGLYAGECLRDKDWHALKRRLEEKGVAVRNECIPPLS